MKVIANQRGYYGEIIREPGEVFEIKSKTELGKWMEPADASEAQDSPAVKSFEKMSKAELIDYAIDRGLELSPDNMTKAQMIEAIEAHKSEPSADVM